MNCTSSSHLNPRVLRASLLALALIGGALGSACRFRIIEIDRAVAVSPVELAPVEPVAVTIESVYPTQGAQWNAYVKFDDGGQDAYHQDDDACLGTEPGRWGQLTGCIHGGEKLKVTVTGETSCSGLTAADDLGAFDWVCAVESGTATFFSSGLKTNKGLRDLITTTPVLGWAENRVSVSRGATLVAQSALAEWWDNEIEPLPANIATGLITLDGVDDDGAGPDDDYPARTILALENSRATKGYLLGDGYGLVTLATAELSANAPDTCMNGEPCVVGFSGSKFAWAEATVDATGTNHSFQSNLASYFVIRGSTGRNGNWEGAWLEDSNSALVANSSFSNCGNSGLYLGYSNPISSFTVQDVTIDQADTGISILAAGATGNHFERISISNVASSGLYVHDDTFNTWKDVSITGYGLYGIYTTDSSDNVYDGITIDGSAGAWCVLADNLDRNVLKNFKLSNCGGGAAEGIRLATDSTDNKLFHWQCANTGTCISFFNPSTIRNVVHDALSVNSTNFSFHQDASDNTFTKITALGSGGSGVYNASSSKMTYAHVTVANGAATGFRGMDGVLVNAVSVNNTFGFDSTIFPTPIASSRVHNLVVAHNSGGGVSLLDADNWNFSGTLMVAANGGQKCSVIGGTNPGLYDGDCTLTGTDGSSGYGAYASTATLRTSQVLSASYVGKVDIDDSLNTSDNLGSRAWASITDWFTFKYALRGYLRDGSSFPNADHQGQCVSGDTCRIWDFRLSSSDTILRNTVADGLNPNPAFVAGAACPAVVHGNQAVTDTHTVPNTFLTAAFEIVEDSVGDDDGLCESNESCIYAPNFGAYQGEGDYLAAGACSFANGAVTGVTIYAYPTNGGTKF